MALSKVKKAILQAKIGEELYELLLKAENVIVTEDGTEKALADVLKTLATSSDLDTVSGKVSTLIGSDADKSARVIAGEVLASAGKLERKKVASVSDIDPTAEGADKYIYMVPKSTAKSGDKYDEYMVIDGAVEKVGDWEVDLADYLTKLTGATAGNLPKIKADGTLEDSGKSVDDFVEKVDGKGLSTNDYSDEEKQKVADAYAARHSHENKAVLDGISAEKVTAWDGKAKVYSGTTQPSGMQSGDIWLQTFAE